MSITTSSQGAFTTPGSYTYIVPKYVYSIVIESAGGGGGGGDAASTKGGSRGGGGGASGAVISKTLYVNPGDAIPYTVGSGGSASSGSGGGNGENTTFTYEKTTYTANGANGGTDATGGAFGTGGSATTPSGGDVNTSGNAGGNGSSNTSGSAGSSASGDGYGTGGAGSSSHISQDNAAGGDGGIKITITKKTPSIMSSSGKDAAKKSASIGGNKLATSKNAVTGKNRIQAAMTDSSIVLSDTSTKLTLGGMPLSLKKASNGNYVFHVYSIDEDTPTYTPDMFSQSTVASMLGGVNIDTFVSGNEKRILAFDRLEDQVDISGFGKLNSNDATSNTVMWLGVPLIVNDDNVFLVSISDSSSVDEFVTTNFMGLPFLVARQGTNYLICAIFDDSNIDLANL